MTKNQFKNEDKTKFETICLTGHRPKSLPWGYNEASFECFMFKIKMRKIFRNAIKFGASRFLTGMAEGFDMICTEILLNLKKRYKNIKVVAVIPCLKQEERWSKEQQKRYQKILKKCDEKIVLSDTYTCDCMNKRNQYMVDNADVCIACWNGKPSGTGNTVRMAKKKGCRIKIIDLWKKKK